MHNDFTLFKRTVPSGEKVVYYYAYADDGKRLCFIWLCFVSTDHLL
jgi:hypothetical protein